MCVLLMLEDIYIREAALLQKFQKNLNMSYGSVILIMLIGFQL